MEEIAFFLASNPSGAFATVDEGKPKVRPWGFMHAHDGKFYFCTANTKDVYKQMLKNPNVEFTSTSKEGVTIRLSGLAKFTNDSKMKQQILDDHAFLKNRYQSVDNPIFEVFYIEHGEATFYDFSGKPPRTISF